MTRPIGRLPLPRPTPILSVLKRCGFSIVLPLLMAGSMWSYFQTVMIPHQQNEAVREDKPRGNLSDLYPRWLGARELLLHGKDPYSAEITGEIQAGYYGRVLDETRPHDPKDQQAFAYPLYVVWLLAPMIGMPFWLAQKATLLLLTVLTASSVLLWLDTFRWQLPFDRKVAWVLLTVSCLPAVQGIKLQQLTLFVAGLIAIGSAAISRGWLASAGVLLALATIKPQLVFLLVVWLGIWVSGDWRGRRKLLWSFAITMTLLVAASEALLPGWIHEFKSAMADYYRYTGGGQSLLDVVFTRLWGGLIAIFLVGVLLVSLWKLRRSPASTAEFNYAVSFILATTLLVIPMFSPYNQILLLPVVVMLAQAISRRRETGFLSRFFVAVTTLSVFWPFLSAAVLVVALPFWRSFIVEKGAGVPFYSTLSLPVAVYATLLVLRNRLISNENGPRTDPEPILRQSAASE